MGEPRQLLECPDRSNLGRRLRLAPGASYQALLDVRGDDAAARAVTVTMTVAPTVRVSALGPDDVLAGHDELRARALIEAGVGGHLASVELDVGAGVTFRASVSSLRVSARNDGGAPVEVGAFIGYGTISARPRLTQIGATMGARATWTFAVPEYASTIEVYRPEDQELLVELGLGRAGDRWLYSDRVARGARMTPLSIANGFRRVRLTNLSTDAFRPVVLFTLAF